MTMMMMATAVKVVLVTVMAARKKKGYGSLAQFTILALLLVLLCTRFTFHFLFPVK